jgi:hypothetical protein
MYLHYNVNPSSAEDIFKATAIFEMASGNSNKFSK